MGVPIFVSALEGRIPGIYEHFPLWRRLVNFFFWHAFLRLIAWVRPLGNFLFSQSSITRKIKQNATNYWALELIYSYRDYIPKLNSWDRFWTKIWLNLINGTSTRNRLQLVIDELDRLVFKLAVTTGQREIRIVSLAAGSARAAIEIAKRARDGRYLHVKVRTLLVDRDRAALKLAQERINSLGLQEFCKVQIGNVLDIEKSLDDFNPDIIEIVGLLDYFNETLTVEYLKSIREKIKNPAWILAGNINYNKEISFVGRIITWDMYYKTPEKMAEIINQAGFSPDDWKIICEPQMVHEIAVACTH